MGLAPTASKVAGFPSFRLGAAFLTVTLMVAFLVETYCSAEALAASRPLPEVVDRATNYLVATDLRVRVLYAAFVPHDEECFFLFEATSPEAVVEASARIGLRLERLNEVVPVWPSPMDDDLPVRPESDRPQWSDTSKGVRPLG